MRRTSGAAVFLWSGHARHICVQKESEQRRCATRPPVSSSVDGRHESLPDSYGGGIFPLMLRRHKLLPGAGRHHKIIFPLDDDTDMHRYGKPQCGVNRSYLSQRSRHEPHKVYRRHLSHGEGVYSSSRSIYPQERRAPLRWFRAMYPRRGTARRMITRRAVRRSILHHRIGGARRLRSDKNIPPNRKNNTTYHFHNSKKNTLSRT